MIKDRRLWEKWESEYRRREVPDFWYNLRLAEAMYEEARSLGIFPPRDPLEGLDVKVKLARIINASTAS